MKIIPVPLVWREKTVSINYNVITAKLVRTSLGSRCSGSYPLSGPDWWRAGPAGGGRGTAAPLGTKELRLCMKTNGYGYTVSNILFTPTSLQIQLEIRKLGGTFYKIITNFSMLT